MCCLCGHIYLIRVILRVKSKQLPGINFSKISKKMFCPKRPLKFSRFIDNNLNTTSTIATNYSDSEYRHGVLLDVFVIYSI